VAPLVVRVDRGAAQGEPFGQRLVAPAVLGVAVDEEQRPAGPLGQPRPLEQAEAVTRRELGFGAAQGGVPAARSAQDRTSLSSRLRAAWTRFR
jgi:hypothetical protein